MNWLSRYWFRDGPGIAKDAPPKQGLALLADVVARNWWELIQLNLLVILFGLPLVTLPAALAAASRITVLMLEDRNVYLGRDFLEAFRRTFWRATALGGIAALGIGLAVAAALVFLDASRSHLLSALPLTVSIAVAVFAMIATAYAFVLAAMSELPLRRILRLALLGALARPLPALAALAFCGLLWVLHIVFYPVSIFMPAVVNFSFGTLAATFGVHQAAVRLLALEQSVDAGAAYAEGSA